MLLKQLLKSFFNGRVFFNVRNLIGQTVCVLFDYVLKYVQLSVPIKSFVLVILLILMHHYTHLAKYSIFRLIQSHKLHLFIFYSVIVLLLKLIVINNSKAYGIQKMSLVKLMVLHGKFFVNILIEPFIIFFELLVNLLQILLQ